MGLILITHDLRVAFSVCDRVYVFYAGRVIEASDVRDLSRDTATPVHRRTSARRASSRPPPRAPAPSSRRVGAEPDEILGQCAFASGLVGQEPCRSERPALVDAGGGHLVACRRIPRDQPELREIVDSAGAPDTEPAMDQSPVLVTAAAVTKTFRGGRNERRSLSPGWTSRSTPVRAWGWSASPGLERRPSVAACPVSRWPRAGQS